MRWSALNTMPELEPEAKDIIAKIGSRAADVGNDLPHWYSLLQEKSKKEKSIEDEENKGILRMRNSWSTTILLLIVTIVLFDIILVWFIGLRIWTFTDTSIVIAIITDNFLKIAGLGYLITTELFKKIFPRK